MTSFDLGARTAAPPATAALPLFATALFVSALLLFGLEPMFAKMALPALGGSPSVWSVAMVFFQTLMFAGYCYAHALTRWLSPRAAALLHGGVLCAALAFLPIARRLGDAPPADADPTLWLIGVFAVSIGVPFFALSAHGPLLQAWFARSGHRQAGDPYFLYGASNIGSFAALLAYPLLIEPLAGLQAQSRAWTVGFVLMAVLIAFCAWTVRGATRAQDDAGARAASPAVAWPTLLRWIALAFVPSALLVSVTAHISNDVAAAPLLWAAPLGLYLLTFVVTFRAGASSRSAWLDALQPWLSAAILMATCIGMFSSMALGLTGHLTLFVVNALVCHAALYSLRPGVRDLTIFYAAMSFGGALGGVFASLAAPLLFSSVVEYPLLLAAALFCRPGAVADLRIAGGRTFFRGAPVLALPALAAPAMLMLPADLAVKLVAVGIGATMLLNWRNPGRVALAGVASVAALLVAQALSPGRESHRSFFGVHRVEEARGGLYRTLSHGTTIHGAIRIRNDDGLPVEGRPVPTTYYAFEGPLGDAVAAARAARGHLRHAAFIGLGAGALACHLRNGEAATFYEIDPLVVWLARDSGRFGFLKGCAPQARIVVGDARLTLQGQQDKSDIVVVDAFSSDAIPTHLLTREAFELYLDRLAPGGLIALHISNNTMDFAGIVARVAADLGLVAYVRRDQNIEADRPDFRTASIAAIVARDPADLNGLPLRNPDWRRVEPEPLARTWTDDYSTVLKAIAAKIGL